jgi:vancomycin permeability regulator SanA
VIGGGAGQAGGRGRRRWRGLSWRWWWGHRPWRDWSRRRRWLICLGALVGAVTAGLGPSLAVAAATAPHLHRGTGGVQRAPVALVLGAGVDGAGRPSPFLEERIRLAVDLFRAGLVRALLMSGDHSRTDYDEVGAMAALAERLGVPASAVVQDHAGFDTFSSCYRARSVWGVSRLVVVSQPFHLTRAVWTCRRLGLEAQGAGTASDDTDATWYGWLREVPAIDKALLDVLRDRTPMFPGPREHALDAVNAAG